jgi:hypothetical protein
VVPNVGETKDNLIRRGWDCMFYVADESIDHRFFSCPFTRFIWDILQCTFNAPVQPSRMAELGGLIITWDRIELQ